MQNSKNSFGILFYIRKVKMDENGNVPIYARVTVNGQRADFSIKRTVHFKKWGEGKVKGFNEEVKSINHYIDTVRNKLFDIYGNLNQNNKAITAANITNIYSGKSERKPTLVEVFKYHNEQMAEKIGIDYAKATFTRHETTLKHIVEFLKYQYKVDDKHLSDLNHQFITDLEHYLKTIRKCNHNSTIKYIRNLRKKIDQPFTHEKHLIQTVRGFGYKMSA